MPPKNKRQPEMELYAAELRNYTKNTWPSAHVFIRVEFYISPYTGKHIISLSVIGIGTKIRNVISEREAFRKHKKLLDLLEYGIDEILSTKPLDISIYHHDQDIVDTYPYVFRWCEFDCAHKLYTDIYLNNEYVGAISSMDVEDFHDRCIKNISPLDKLEPFLANRRQIILNNALRILPLPIIAEMFGQMY